MRLIGKCKNEKEAYHFSCFLLKEEIPNTYEKGSFQIWVQEEDDSARATAWLERFQENPSDPIFSDISQSPKVIAAESKKHLVKKVKVEFKPFRFTFTHFIVLLCAFLFFCNSVQEVRLVESYGPLAEQVALTPIEQELLFDYPEMMQQMNAWVESENLQSYKTLQELPPEEQTEFQKLENIPTWKGVYNYYTSKTQEKIVLFEKIRQGEIWRLFTPCLLHGNLLHILFNMLWVLVLGKQIGQRLRFSRYLFLILASGIIPNVAQYLVGGPFFLGYSGVVVAMAGFIWVRQKIAPWEGYPLPRSTAIFILVFVCAMFFLELGSFFFQMGTPIANTAHIGGGLVGMGIARIPFLARSGK